MDLKRLFNWVIEIWDWLAEGKIVFMGLFVVSATLLWMLVTGHSETSIRIAGYILQLIGMIFAIRGLLGVREHFGQPLLRNLFIAWVKRFPKWKKRTVIGAGAAAAGTSTVKARLEVWSQDDPDLHIEERIQRIVMNLAQIRTQQLEDSEAIESLKSNHEKHKEEVSKERNLLEERIQLNLESLHTSDLITSLVGLVWLTVGISLSTFAPELCKWLK